MPFIHPESVEYKNYRSTLYGVFLRPKYLSAVIEVMKHYGWKDIIYIYDSDDGLIRLQQLFTYMNLNRDETYGFKLKAVKRINTGIEGAEFLKRFERDENERPLKKHVLLDSSADLARSLISSHVRDIYVHRRSYHFLLTDLIMDDFHGVNIAEFGAVNVTGFKMLKRGSTIFRSFIKTWKDLDPRVYPGAGSKTITVSTFCFFCGFCQKNEQKR